jgi:hypothetical protein
MVPYCTPDLAKSSRQKVFFWAGDLLFGSAKKHPKNRQTPNKERPFFDTMRIAPPHRHNFTIDLQRRWLINCKIGDRQGMSNCFRHALTIAVLLFFFVGGYCCVFFVEPPSTCQFELFKDAEWRVKGGECVPRHPNRRVATRRLLVRRNNKKNQLFDTEIIN